MTSQTSELVAFLRGHHVYCTAPDGRFEQAADLLERLSSSEVTEEMLRAGRFAWQSAVKDRNLDLWLARIYLDMRSAATSERKG